MVAVAVAGLVDIADLRAVVDGLVFTAPGDLSDVTLADELIELRAQIDRQEAQFAKLSSGPTDLWNLVLICPHHHDVLHQPGWTATFGNNQFRVYRPNGTEVT